MEVSKDKTLIKISKLKIDLNVTNRLEFWQIFDGIDSRFLYMNAVRYDFKSQKVNSIDMKLIFFEFSI